MPEKPTHEEEAPSAPKASQTDEFDVKEKVRLNKARYDWRGVDKNTQPVELQLELEIA